MDNKIDALLNKPCYVIEYHIEVDVLLPYFHFMEWVE